MSPDEFFSKVGKYDDQLIIDIGVTLDTYFSKKEVKTKGIAEEVRKIFRSNLKNSDPVIKGKVKLLLKYI